MDLIIECVGIIDPEESSASERDIAIRDGLIEAVELPGRITRDATRLDGSRHYAIPGLVNAHTHSHNALVKGIGDAWTLELLLNHGPALNSRRTAEDHYWAAVLNGLEMLKSGATAAYDLVIHSPTPTVETLGAVVQAYRDLGMRAVVAPAVADLPFFDVVPGLKESLPDDLRGELETLLPTPAGEILAHVRAALMAITSDDLVRLAVAPTIPAQCSDEFLIACRDLAREFDTGLHTHLAESKAQAVEGIRRYGETLTSHLHRLGLLGPDLVAAHGVWLTDQDVAALASHGSMLAHNPTSNLRLGSGVAPVSRYRSLGLQVAIGTDGSASSDHQNIIEAMRLAGHVSRLYSADPAEWLDSPAILDLAIRGGRSACGFPVPARASIEAGMPADLVLLRRDAIGLSPAVNLPSQIVNCESGSAVDTVIVAGSIVMREGVSTRVDEDRALAAASSASQRIRGANRAELEFARRLSSYLVQACSDLALAPYPVDRFLVASAEEARLQ